MGKVIKKSVKVFLIVAIVLLSVPTSIWLLVQNSSVQSWLVDKTTSILEENLGTTVRIEKFDYRPFNRVLLRNVLIEDLKGDTLIATEKLTASLLRFSSEKKIMSLHRVTLTKANINLVTDSLGVMNLTELLNRIISKPKEPSDEVFTVNMRNIRVEDSQFRLHSYESKPTDGIDFNDMHLSGLNIDATDLDIAGDTISLFVSDMNFLEKSGFTVDRFRSSISLGSKHMDFEKLRVDAMGAQIYLPYLRMAYNDWDDMGDFLEKVKLRGTIDKSKLTTHFLSFFVPGLNAFNEQVSIEADLRGTISDLRIKNLKLSAKDSTMLAANINLIGLPDFNSTLMFIDIKDFKTTIEDIESIENLSTNERIVDLPENFTSLRTIGYAGTFTGFISDFVAYGTLSSAIGDVTMDLSFKPGKGKLVNFKGNVSTNEFNVGELTGVNEVGKTSLEATVTGVTDYNTKLEVNTDASIFSLVANNYRYQNIDVSGNLSSKKFIGSLSLDDPNAKLNFTGKVDFADTLPVFDFSAFVPKLDLVKLNLNNVDSLSQASFLLTANISGNSLDNSQGEVKLVNGMYRNQNGEIKTNDITINANNTVESKLISVKSEFAEGELRGKYNYENIFSSFQQLIYLYIPALSPDNKKPQVTYSGVDNPEYNDYIIKLRVKRTRKLTDVLFPNFRIAENTNVFGIYNPDFQSLTLKVMIPELKLGSNVVRNVSIDGQTNDSAFVASLSAPYVDIGGTYVRNISLNASASNNNLSTSVLWDNRTSIKNKGEIQSNTIFEHGDGYNKINFHLAPSKFFLNDTIWNVASSQVIVDSSLITINNFRLFNNKQNLRVNGSIASVKEDSIRVDLENIDASNLNFYTNNLGYNFSGDIDGYAVVSDVINNPLFYGDLMLHDLIINEQEVGNVQLTSQWFAEENRLSLNALNTLNEKPRLQVVGSLYPDNGNIDFNVDIEELQLTHIEPLMAGEVLDIGGATAGNVKVTGTLDKPNMNGKLQIIDGAGTINFTRTRYSLNDPIYIENSNLFFRDFKIVDANNKLASLSGSVSTNYFKDITLDLLLTPKNFQFLNTTERDNELFYGTVFATGQARINGTPNDLNMNVSVKTNQRTAIFLPLASSKDVAEHDFVNFINRSDEIIIIEDIEGVESLQKSNLNLTLDMEVTPDADVQIIIDKQLGDIIRANGAGKLKMEINPSEDVFNMFGNYVIERGDYLFTLQGVINKRFKIGDGSTITWNGDVEDAIMDINAIYSLRTSLGPLNPNPDTEDDKFSRRTQVDCQINLEGKLMEPNINFDIKVPIAETDPEIEAVVQDALNTDERMSKQFLSLLVINNFTSPEDQMMGGFSQGLASTASEMLSNQLSNWLSQWSSTFDIGVNYRPGDEISSNEIELALSTQLFNDRVTINSNVDMGNDNASTPLAGDFSIDVKIIPSGKLRVKAFARTNDDIYSSTSQTEDYTTGAGVMYREDFNTFNELWEKYKRFFKRENANDVWQDSYSEFNPDISFIPDSTRVKQKPYVFIK
ncbi:MAG: translocation/assembly module TamB domain-containing protein [Bacteroidales bacterium]